MSDITSGPQGTIEWVTARLGKATASRVSDIIAKTKNGWGASRANYMAELIAERLTGIPADSYQSAAMKWGIETEAEARNAYSFMRDAEVVECGFIDHPKIPMTGASPDGLVGDDGLVEFKCPNTATQIDTLLGKGIDAKYIAQVQWQMACTSRKWADWVSYDPRLPGSMRLHVQRVKRDDAMIAELERLIPEFLSEVEQRVRTLTEKFGQKEAA